MIGLIIFLVSLLLAGGIMLSTRANMYGPETEDRYKNKIRGDFQPSWLFLPIGIFIIGVLVMLFQPYSLTRVEMGHVGLKVNLTGDARGVSDYQYKTGWVAYNDWTEQLNQFPTFQQHIEYDTIEVITRGGFSAKIKPSFNYSLVTNMIGDMFQNLKKPVEEVEQGWLKNAVYSSVNDVANQWPVDSIFNHREQFEAGIISECNKRVNKWFTVSQLRSNIIPPPALQAAIIAKTKAIQEAQGEVQKAIVADAQARVKIANSKGDSAQVVIKAHAAAEATLIDADATAKAMKLKQAQLTALYVEYIKAQTWDGKLPSTVLGNNSGSLINLK